MSIKKPTLAFLGGDPVIATPLERYNSIGPEEVRAASEVVESGVLSRFLGSWGPDFFGGPKVQQFERDCETFFGVEHAVSVNSWTSGLIAAVGALGIEPGDEVITSPWTMCASATAILHWNAIPVFADIDAETYCLSPESIEANISPHTRAILSVDIMGQSADMDVINEIARRHGLRVISDTAQAPAAKYKESYAGTLADIGGFSLNYHKHVHTGEGGVLVTNDSELAERLQLIRNHAEAVVGPKGVARLDNMLGYNFRLGEIEAAIGIEQLKKLPGIASDRARIATELTSRLEGLAGLSTPRTRDGSTHVYYVYPMTVDPGVIGVDKHTLCAALRAEGVPALSPTFANVHLLPMYQEKIAYGGSGFPWTSDICRREVDYRKGICPVAEDLQDRTYLGLLLCEHQFYPKDLELVATAFHKVWNHLEDLK